jgi:hypothetical protein
MNEHGSNRRRETEKRADETGSNMNGSSVVPDELAKLPLLGIVLFAGQCIRRVQWLLWGATRKEEDWVVTVDNVLALAKRLALAPSSVRSSEFRKESERLYADGYQFSYDARINADPPATHVMLATFHLTAALLKIREVATHWKKKDFAQADERTNSVCRMVVMVLKEAVEAVPPSTAKSVLADMHKSLETLQKATREAKEKEQALHQLQPIEFGDSLESDGILSRPMKEKVPSPPAETELVQAIDDLDKASAELTKLQWQVARKIERTLKKYAGRSFGSVEANKRFSESVNDLLRKHGARLVCPTCDTPSILYLQTTGTTRNGSFQHQHFSAGKKTRHGGSVVVPSVTVVPIAATPESATSPSAKTG